MNTGFLFFLLYGVCLVRAKSYRFAISKELNDGKYLPKEEWSYVEIDGLCSDNPEILISVQVEMPDYIFQRKPSMLVFFANDAHRVLGITFKERLKVTFYKTPYDVEHEIVGPELLKTFSKTVTAACRFTNTWLPKNCTKISGALTFSNGTIYNYYGIRNYKISIPDIMVPEEFKNIDCFT